MNRQVDSTILGFSNQVLERPEGFLGAGKLHPLKWHNQASMFATRFSFAFGCSLLSSIYHF
ncbi:hypothetical protein AMATHDRAFT_71276 [Amanita thiersii Skay4041]|uniref:Uncharacterized protein n=1 Tax=Amanita thiersii Skay4041 TaxID=703135 RepID=A0A2A9ND51_9AGAR|nr:hypothetical protein AMATHDRAFT_71276 [Amanita thiersii Skay4041]